MSVLLAELVRSCPDREELTRVCPESHRETDRLPAFGVETDEDLTCDRGEIRVTLRQRYGGAPRRARSVAQPVILCGEPLVDEHRQDAAGGGGGDAECRRQIRDPQRSRVTQQMQRFPRCPPTRSITAACGTRSALEASPLPPLPCPALPADDSSDDRRLG